MSNLLSVYTQGVGRAWDGMHAFGYDATPSGDDRPEIRACKMW